MSNQKLQKATFANGCFWCTEAIFKRVKGVESVNSGYTGGEMENPTYYDVASKTTGHAEALQIEFDTSVISYETILDIFFATHDPTTLNQQGYDVGPEYRSAIFYHDAEQKTTAEAKIDELNKTGKYKNPIVTEVSEYTKFYTAEEEHHNFYESGSRPEYCRVIIDPKIKKLLNEFKDEVKEEYKA